jgi:hypothetical protein
MFRFIKKYQKSIIGGSAIGLGLSTIALGILKHQHHLVMYGLLLVILGTYILKFAFDEIT